ncbi:hypothetical protein LSH36_100g12060 [Paralvinella palmiformis]|uniref:Uncharacterized protein n=1 Tax=Paralvinella palmiformis TaxID=53620 RepID=A0AAD9K0W9_9ANNE|nr:hypothetical protein LSH36_100g12060 [Paralvinella palmiformis]
MSMLIINLSGNSVPLYIRACFYAYLLLNITEMKFAQYESLQGRNSAETRVPPGQQSVCSDADTAAGCDDDDDEPKSHSLSVFEIFRTHRGRMPSGQ